MVLGTLERANLRSILSDESYDFNPPCSADVVYKDTVSDYDLVSDQIEKVGRAHLG